MKSNVVLKFLILAVIVCMIMSAWAAAWSAFVSIVWNTVLFPTARCCTRMAQAWMQVSSNPSNYRLREPYDSLGVLRHPYFNDSLNLTLVERHILVASKCTGLFVLCYVTAQVLQYVAMALGIRTMISARTKENAKIVDCPGGGIPHGFMFWISHFFKPTFPLLAHQPSGSTKKEPIWPYSFHASESGEVIFWFSNFWATLIRHSHNHTKITPGIVHPPGHIAKGTVEIIPSADMESVSPMLEEVDPFQSPLVSEKFRPLATSSPRGSSMQDSASGSRDFGAMLEDDVSLECKYFHNVADSPGFLGDEDSMGTLVHLFGDGSPVPRSFSVSANIKHDIIAGPINDKRTPATSTPLSCPTVVQVLVRDSEESAETAELPYYPHSTSMECTGASSSPLVSSPCILFPPTSNSNGQAIDKDEQRDCCSTSPGIKERPGAMITDARTEHHVQRISRGAALGILKHVPRIHNRSLSDGKALETYILEDVSAVPTDAVDEASTVAGTESLAPADRAVGAFPPLDSAEKEKSGFSSLLSPADAVDKALEEMVYIDTVRRKVVAKTRLFEDAYKRATAGLRPEKKRQQRRVFLL